MTTVILRYLVAAFAILWLESCSSEPAVVPQKTAQAGCVYQGSPFSEGGVSCQSNIQYRCVGGAWVSLNTPCGNSPVAAAKPCSFSGISFATGSTSCQSDSVFRCENGVWQDLGAACVSSDSPIRVSPGARTCMFGGATVASNSSICRTGSTFLCSDGEWVNLGTACR